MIAIIGKVGVGKSYLIEKLSKKGFKTLKSDNFINEKYKKDQILYKLINEKIGNFLNDDKGINKTFLKQWIYQNEHNLDILEKIVFNALFDELKNKKYDFVEIPILINKNYDFSSLFDKVLCLETNEKNYQKNLEKRNVDNLFKNKIMKKNDPFLIKKQLFGKLPIVNIYVDEHYENRIIDIFLEIL